MESDVKSNVSSKINILITQKLHSDPDPLLTYQFLQWLKFSSFLKVDMHSELSSYFHCIQDVGMSVKEILSTELTGKMKILSA